MTNQVRVNLKTKVINSAIRYEKREGRDVIVVPSATLPDGITMNRVHYPAEAIEAGYKTLDQTPAPLGHPMINGMYVSAFGQQAQNMYSVGAWNENVRRENGRVFLDKIIDVEVANSTERGRKLLEVINKQEPISTSTGLMLTCTEVDHPDYDLIANTIEADHDAILIGEAPAASTQQGVGIFVNKDGTKVDVHNEEIEFDEDELESMAQMVAYRIEREVEEEKRKPLVEKIKQKLRAMLGGLETTKGDALSVNHDEGTPMNEEQQKAFDALAAKVEDLATNALKADVLEPITKALETLTANAKAAEEAEHTELSAKLIKANMFDSEDDTKELSVNALRKLAAKIPAPSTAAPVFPAFAPNSNDEELFSSELPDGE